MSVGQALKAFRLGQSKAKTAKEAVKLGRSEEQAPTYTGADAAAALAARKE